MAANKKRQGDGFFFQSKKNLALSSALYLSDSTPIHALRARGDEERTGASTSRRRRVQCRPQRGPAVEGKRALL